MVFDRKMRIFADLGVMKGGIFVCLSDFINANMDIRRISVILMAAVGVFTQIFLITFV